MTGPRSQAFDVPATRWRTTGESRATGWLFRVLVVCGLLAEQVRVGPAGGDQLGMRALLDDPAQVKHTASRCVKCLMEMHKFNLLLRMIAGHLPVHAIPSSRRESCWSNYLSTE